MTGGTLVVFDLDGTLLDSNAVDEECFRAAFRSCFGDVPVASDWNVYGEVTDAGIARAVLGEAFGPQGLEERVLRHRDAFCELLEGRLAATGPLRPIPGARELLATLRPGTEWALAVATGGWGRSARRKLLAAGLSLDGAAFASSDDDPVRARIVQHAISRATADRGEAFGRVVAVGDGVWDVVAAAELELPFVGVGRGGRARQLRAAGAGVVLADFGDLTASLDALQDAPVPRS